MSEYERVILVKQEVFIYRIPPLQSDRGHKAADWKLDAPDFTGRLRVVNCGLGKQLELRLEDKANGTLFAKAPIDEYPGLALEAVTDSSRYFVIRLKNDNGQNAFVGMGFADRGDSFDLNVALQDHFKDLKKTAELSKQTEEFESKPKLDLGLKEGEMITINIGNKSGSSGRARPKPSGGAPVPLLPPPPSHASSPRVLPKQTQIDN